MSILTDLHCSLAGSAPGVTLVHDLKCFSESAGRQEEDEEHRMTHEGGSLSTPWGATLPGEAVPLGILGMG